MMRTLGRENASQFRQGGLMTTAKKKWVASVKTDSTHPPAGLFTKDASTIASALASKEVSPKGPGSGMRMLTYFINRAGRELSAKRRTKLEKAKSLLDAKIERQRKSQAHAKRRRETARLRLSS
jgi:tRNA(adenine34) deaminase